MIRGASKQTRDHSSHHTQSREPRDLQWEMSDDHVTRPGAKYPQGAQPIHLFIPAPSSQPLFLLLGPPTMSSSLAPLAPTYRPGDDAAQLASREAAALAADAAAAIEPNVFTEAQIDEYKEQDRYLPVSPLSRIVHEDLG